MSKVAISNQTTFPTYHGHWFWKALKEMIKDPLQFYENRRAELGNTFFVKFPFRQNLMTSDPELIKYFLQTNQKNYEKDRGYDQLALFMGRGLVTSRGDFWKKQRRIAQPTFYRKNLMKLYEAMMIVAQNYLAELQQKKGTTIDIAQEMMAVTARIAMKALFSKDLKDGFLDIYKSISYAQAYTTSRATNPLVIPFMHLNGKHQRFKKEKKVMDNLINQLIDERRASTEKKPDFLQMLLDARYEDTGEPMPQQLLLDELITIFAAGHETSANGLGWTLYLLSQYPEIVAKLRAEIQAVLGNRIPTYEDLKQLTYTKQVIEEGMRVFPPVWVISRYARTDDQWKGVKIKANTIIFAHIYGLHHNPDLWENPTVFNPDRFAPEKSKTRPKSHYMPFGSGPRMCIGSHFAMMEMQLLLPLLIRDFDFELVKEHKIIPEPLITLRPKYGIKMRVK